MCFVKIKVSDCTKIKYYMFQDTVEDRSIMKYIQSRKRNAK